MLVHFIASKSTILKEIDSYRVIIQTIEQLGHTISRQWVEEAYTFALNRENEEKLDWRSINDENVEALSKADVVIAEASTKSFSTGFQTAAAIQQKKPTLILTKNDSLKGTFGSGIDSDFVRYANYSQDTLKDIIADFLNENNIDAKDLRFNFFIDRQIYNYLRWASYKTGKTKAEILRELVNKEIEGGELFK